MKNNSISGFTLIEILIALAILGIALTAIIQTTSQNIKDTHYIQQKTIASWIGKNIINETRAGLIKLPKAPDSLTKESRVLGQQWLWKASLGTTPNPKIQEINVALYRSDNEIPIIQMKGFLYAQ